MEEASLHFQTLLAACLLQIMDHGRKAKIKNKSSNECMLPSFYTQVTLNTGGKTAVGVVTILPF